MRKYLCMGLALVAALAIAGCGASKGKSNETASSAVTGSSKSYPELRWAALPGLAGALDSLKTPEGEIFAVESLAVQSLMEFEPDGKVKPGLASSVDQPNPATYVYHLRAVKFSDGTPMTAADVVFSLDRNIDGKESWDKSYWEDVASITARNSSTVVVKLKHPSPIFQSIVAFSGRVIERAAAEKAGEKALGTPGHMLIGTGPWKLDSYTPDVSVVLSQNPYWTGPRPPAEKITIDIFKTEAAAALAMRSGAIDGVDTYAVPKEFAGIPGTHQLRAPGLSNVMVTLNTDHPPFNDIHVRRAIAYATNTEGMIHALYPGGDAIQDHTIMPNDLFDNLGSKSEVKQMLESLPQYDFNLAKARQELMKSVYPHGFSTSIEVISGNEAQDSAAQIMATDLQEIGIKATVDELTPEQALAWNTGKLHFILSRWEAEYPDPEAYMSLILAPSQIGSLNEASYRNSEVDKLRSESVETLSKPKRMQLIGRLLRTVNNEAPYRSLFTILTLAAISEKYVYPGFSYWTQIFTPWALNVKLAS